jgi:transcriptional antiterminator RfaH
MPTLAAEPSLYPEDLFDVESFDGQDRNWWAVYTKPRQEKSLVRQLVAQRVPVYLPLVNRQAVVNRRRIKSLVPLFSSYVFVYADPEERIKTLDTNRVVQMIQAPNSAETARDLRRIQAMVNSGASLSLESGLTPGTMVRVKTGSLLGLEGEIISRRGETRLLVAVKFLQQGVSILIDDFQVEKL